MHPDWARSLRDQCRDAGVAYFHKQNGEWAPKTGPLQRGERVVKVTIGGCIDANDPCGTWMVRVGKKAAGRLLDGREHNEFPEATP